MSLPAFNKSGDLPVGVHAATLNEVIERFGKASLRRQEQAKQLKRAWTLARATGKLMRFVLFGSFVTDKLEPNDFDGILVMANDFDAKTMTGESRLLFEHGAAQTSFGASLFWYPESAAKTLGPLPIEHWQIKRDRTRRGIVEIVAEAET
jgi:hypothetical protein